MVCRSKQPVQCNCSMFKCGDKNVRKQQADVCEFPFQQPTHSAGEHNVGKKGILHFSEVRLSLCTTQCSVFNAQPFDKTNSLRRNTHMAHTRFHLSSYSRCRCVSHMNTYMRLLIKSQISYLWNKGAMQLHSPTTEMKNRSWIHFQLFREYISVGAQMLGKLII